MFNILMEFGSNNLIILFILLLVVVLATIIVFVVDKKKDKDEVREAIKTIDSERINEERVGIPAVKEEVKPVVEERKEEVVVETPAIEKQEELAQPEVVISPVVEEEKEQVEETIYEKEKKEEEKKEEAKQELERLEKTLQEEKEERIGPTDFEIEQERTAIINYEELKKAAGTIEVRDEKLLQDEGNEPISIDDLYRRENIKKEEIKPVIEEIKVEKKVEEKKFKNSEVLSPVFGVTKEHKDLVNDVKHSEVMKAVDLEIAKTEKFLKELKELREKLN